MTTVKSLQLVPTEGLTGKALEDAKAENAVRKQMRQFISDVRDRKVNQVEDGVNMVFAAAKAIQLAHEKKKLASRVKELETQLNQRKQAASVQRNRTVAGTFAPKKKEPETSGNFLENFERRVAELAKG